MARITEEYLIHSKLLGHKKLSTTQIYARVNRYLFFLENKSQMKEVLRFCQEIDPDRLNPNFLGKNLTRREMEIAMSILEDWSYKDIGEDLFIAESTVSKLPPISLKRPRSRTRRNLFHG